jgi:signal peptidase I
MVSESAERLAGSGEVLDLKDPPKSPTSGSDGPPNGGSNRTPPERPGPSAKRRALGWVAVLAIAACVALLLRIFVVQTFYVPSVSMSPTLKVGDRIIVNKLAYRLHGVGRGDIIVFRAPARVRTECGDDIADLVKRVVGLPGETISDKAGKVYVNGKVLPQPWLPKNDSNTRTLPFPPVHIGPNDYFVMGDNRMYSCDSRFWGTVSRSAIIGKVEMRIWPLGRIHFF